MRGRAFDTWLLRRGRAAALWVGAAAGMFALLISVSIGSIGDGEASVPYRVAGAVLFGVTCGASIHTQLARVRRAAGEHASDESMVAIMDFVDGSEPPELPPGLHPAARRYARLQLVAERRRSVLRWTVIGLFVSSVLVASLLDRSAVVLLPLVLVVACLAWWGARQSEIRTRAEAALARLGPDHG